MFTFKNYTPHAVNLISGGEQRVFPSEGVARCAVEETKPVFYDGVPTISENFGEIYGLPEEGNDVVYIVSQVVKSAAKAAGRYDCVSPAKLVRDAEGRIIGCAAFSW